METVESSLTDYVARLLSGDPTPEEVLRRVLDLAVVTIEAVDGASITIYDTEGKPFTTATTADWVTDVDNLQYSTLQGPCLQVAMTTAPVASCPDVAQSDSWPVFGPQASAAGVRAVLAAGISSHPDAAEATQPPGALNLYARADARFTDDDRERAVLIAATAGLGVMLAEERADNRRLHEALSSRDVIGQAKGILMERHGIGADEAFDTLRRASNRLNIKLRDIAARVTDPQRTPQGRDKAKRVPKR